MIKKANIGWLLFGIGALVFCTPLGVIPALFYGVYFYPAQFARNIERGKPLVQAVYGYRNATGLYPARLDDLVPGYIAATPIDWQYTPPSDGRPPRLQLHGAFHSYLNYYFAVRASRSCHRGCGRRAGSITRKELFTSRGGTNFR